MSNEQGWVTADLDHWVRGGGLGGLVLALLLQHAGGHEAEALEQTVGSGAGRNTWGVWREDAGVTLQVWTQRRHIQCIAEEWYEKSGQVHKIHFVNTYTYIIPDTYSPALA